jgi:hypothetical protein
MDEFWDLFSTSNFEKIDEIPIEPHETFQVREIIKKLKDCVQYGSAL